MQQDLSTKYTVIRLESPDHQQKLVKYLAQYKDLKKTSYCRFYLRGLCIMKSQFCKFAHDFDELNLDNDEYKRLSLMQCAITQKEQRKKLFIQKTDFFQRPLFFIKKLDYMWLYNYQFSQRYKKSNIAPLTIEEVNKNQPVRNRIREIMHREQWDKFIDFIQFTFPDADYTIQMYSLWFAKLGFEKGQTFCKFGDFMRYLIYVRGYVELNIVVPPMLARNIYFVKNKTTMMYSLLDDLVKDSEIHRANVRKIKQERMKTLSQDLQKKFICRFYMSGNCQKTREECFYVHNIVDIRYDKNQQFLKAYRQPPKSKEDRLNYISLSRFYNQHKLPDQKEINLDDINADPQFKFSIRKRVHLGIYKEFLQKLEKQYEMQYLPVSFVRNQYQKFGFNHTDQNKFGQLQGYFWDLGYYTIDLVNELRQRHQYISVIPPIEVMDKFFYHKLLGILQEELDQSIKQGEKPQILQSSLRRLVYSYSTDKNKAQIPLHVYLRKKKITLKKVLEQFYPQYCQNIFFQSSQQNFKKLIDFIKKYFKRYKKFVYTLDQIDSYIRGLKKEEINMNSFVNYKALLELGLLQIGKQIYFWPFTNATLIMDRAHPPQEQKIINLVQHKNEVINKQFLEKFEQCNKQKYLVVDNASTLEYCSVILRSCYKYGVDLQGRLALGGYIDFVQVSCINERKYIFIIDIFKIKKNESELFDLVVELLRQIFQDENRLKIMHSCQQDVVALSCCLKIKIRHIFDTSGTEIYLQQRAIYQNMRQKNISFEHTIKQIHNTKTPGLNQVLEKWGAPNGPNQYKEEMKKIFNQAGRQYFETRPIIKQFLLYSARDVEDLIEVQQSMVKSDPEQIWRQIGNLYANFKQQ